MKQVRHSSEKPHNERFVRGTGVAIRSSMAKSRKRDQSENWEGESAAPEFAGDTTADNPDRERLASRAYELYMARGGSDGQDLDDWLTAERELVGSRQRPTDSDE